MVDGLLDMAPGVAWTRAGGVDRELLDVAFRARRFARRVIRPAALELDRRMARDHDYFPWDIVRAGAAEHWLTAAMPQTWGGDGIPIAAMSASIEEMCAGCAGIANIFGAHGLGMLPIMLAMDLDLGERVLGHVAAAERAGDPVLCAFAITEPGGGSDVQEHDGLALGDVRSYATRVSGGYKLTGRKVFISNGSVAEYTAVFAALDRGDPRSSWTGFVVRRGTPGFRVARVENKMGQRACPAAEIELDDAFVPTEDLIGEEGGGSELSRKVLAVSRGPVGAIAVGIARDAYETCHEYLRAHANGSRQPWIDDALAGMAVKIRAARATYLEAAFHIDQVVLPSRSAIRVAGLIRRAPIVGRKLVDVLQSGMGRGMEEAWAHQAVLGATAKIVGSDAAMAVTTSALDIIPLSAGPLRARAEKAFRDAKLTQIYEGTNQICRRAVTQETWQRTLG